MVMALMKDGVYVEKDDVIAKVSQVRIPGKK